MKQTLLTRGGRTPASACLLALMLLTLLGGCFGENTPEPTPQPPASTATTAPSRATEGPAPQTVTATAAPGRTAPRPSPTTAQPVATNTPAQTGPQPLITLAVNSSRESEVYQGWPVLLEVSLLHPEAMRSDKAVLPLRLGAEGRPWVAALSLEAVDARGRALALPLSMGSAPSGTVTLDDDSISTVYWSLAPEATARLAEGSYALTAVLDMTDGASGWRGAVSSIPAVMRIAKAPARLSPEQEALRIQLLAAHDVAQGNVEEAMSRLDELLKAQPENVDALEFKGDLLSAGGKTAEALEVYNDALRIFHEQNPDADEPPFGLLDKQNELIDLLLGQE